MEIIIKARGKVVVRPGTAPTARDAAIKKPNVLLKEAGWRTRVEREGDQAAKESANSASKDGNEMATTTISPFHH